MTRYAQRTEQEWSAKLDDELRYCIAGARTLSKEEAYERFSCKVFDGCKTSFKVWHNDNVDSTMLAIIEDGYVLTVLREPSAVYSRKMKLCRLFDEHDPWDKTPDVRRKNNEQQV